MIVVADRMERMLIFATIIACLSFAVSALHIWYTLFRRGSVKMTQPAFIFFGPDGHGREGKPKVALCAHLYSTAQRGSIVEGIFVRLTNGGTTHDFDVWVYGSGGLERGSGVHVGQEGVTCNHHFLLPPSNEGFRFTPGDYTVEVFGTVVGEHDRKRFWRERLSLTEPIHETGAGVFFNWRPSAGKFEANVDDVPARNSRFMNMTREIPYG